MVICYNNFESQLSGIANFFASGYSTVDRDEQGRHSYFLRQTVNRTQADPVPLLHPVGQMADRLKIKLCYKICQESGCGNSVDIIITMNHDLLS